MTDRLTEAICLATRAHAGQTDKAGEPYILHPLRVMQAVSPEARVVAVLHDVIEDTEALFFRLLDWPGRLPYDLKLPWGPACALTQGEHADLELLTRIKGQSYDDYLIGCGQTPSAREVKIADLKDNLSRPASLPDSLRKRYEKALAVLEGGAG